MDFSPFYCLNCQMEMIVFDARAHTYAKCHSWNMNLSILYEMVLSHSKRFASSIFRLRFFLSANIYDFNDILGKMAFWKWSLISGSAKFFKLRCISNCSFVFMLSIIIMLPKKKKIYSNANEYKLWISCKRYDILWVNINNKQNNN